jgi:uncharacterized protein YceK
MASIRKPALLLSIALCVALTTSGCSAIIEAQTRNAFDEMYLSVKHPKASDTWFGYMEHMGGRALSTNVELDGLHFGTYNASLFDGESLLLTVDICDETIDILGKHEVADTRCISFVYWYDFPHKTLTIKPVSLLTSDYIEMGVERSIDDGEQLAAYFAEQGVTRDDIEHYRDYFLYDKVLTDWVTGNGARSRFSPGDFGYFTVIDDTFANLGEDWR